jgi:hypothetical protein
MWLRNTAWRRAGVFCCSPVFIFILISLLLVSSLRAAAGDNQDKNKDKHTQPLVVRWSEEQPGCTFSRGDDGKYRYGLWSGDAGFTLAIDARELQIIPHRNWPFFGVFLTIRYRGAGSLDASPEGVTLQFINHFKVMQTSLDPDGFSEKIQSDADALDDETRRAVARHPEKKQALEARLQDYQKSANEMIEFLGRNSLRPAHLDRANPEVSGWVYFDTKTKWLGSWKTQEEFILRLPLDEKVFEFPFKLPPRKGELLLRKRE